MPTPHRSQMASTTNNMLMCLKNNVVANLIGDKGCEALSKADWPFLKNLNL
jgi:hypothetical protein